MKMTVKDIMTRNVITVSPDTEITRAAELLIENHINGLPVVDQTGKLVGILCQSDLIAQQKKLPIPSYFTLLDGLIPLKSMKLFEKEIQKIVATRVSQAMTPNPVFVGPDTKIETATSMMVDHNFHTLPVVDGERLIGVIGKEDMLKTLIA